MHYAPSVQLLSLYITPLIENVIGLLAKTLVHTDTEGV